MGSEIGPISIVLTTSATLPFSPYGKLHERISSIKARLPNKIARSLSLHVLHTTQGDEASPNAFLNLARMFAQTSRVVLFPGDLSILPASINISTTPQIRTVSRRISMLSNQNDTKFPFPNLTPVLMSQEHHVWCTERSFLLRSRDLDWDSCLWQLWLDSFGDMDILRVSGWIDKDAFILPVNSTAVSFIN